MLCPHAHLFIFGFSFVWLKEMQWSIHIRQCLCSQLTLSVLVRHNPERFCDSFETENMKFNCSLA